MKRVLAIWLCGAMAAICCVGTASAQAPRRAPSWALMDSGGHMHDLLDYRGKVLIIDMMKTTCPHCASFAGVLAQVQQKYGDRVAIVSVVSPTNDNAQAVQGYIAQHKITYPVVFDMGQMQYSYVLKGSVELPHVYIVDQNGYIQGDYDYNVTTRGLRRPGPLPAPRPSAQRRF